MLSAGTLSPHYLLPYLLLYLLIDLSAERRHSLAQEKRIRQLQEQAEGPDKAKMLRVEKELADTRDALSKKVLA